MTAQISAYGRLVADVQTRTTSNNKQMAFTRIAVALPCQKAESDGGTQTGYQVIADTVLSARTVRPGGKKGQQGQAAAALQRAQHQQPPAHGYEDYDQSAPYDDSVPF